MKLAQWTVLVILGALASAGGGCWSVYHRSPDQFGFAETDRLERRFDDAQAAARDALELVQHARAGRPEGSAAAVSTAAWEFDRRVASVHDVAARAESTPQETAARASLDAAAAELNKAAQAMDAGDAAPAKDALARAEAALREVTGERR